jgi:two-component sensor histidine kinase
MYANPGTAISMRFEMEDLQLGIDAAIPCGLIVNELVTNALKHAFLGRERGIINIRFSREKEKYVVGVGDDGVGLPEGIDVETTETLGLHLVSTLADQLGATLSVVRQEGTSFTLSFEERRAKPIPIGE